MRGPAAPTVEQFYQALGFAGYEAIDINSRYGSLIMMEAFQSSGFMNYSA